MADAQVTGYIGCPVCVTVLFKIMTAPADRQGVFQNVGPLPMDGVPDDTSQAICAVCGGQLGRVVAP